MNSIPFWFAICITLASCRNTATAPEVRTLTLELTPFTLAVRPAAKQPAPALNSFVMAEHDDKWLLLGGRTNGFHRTSDRESTFPVKQANDKIYVVDPVGGRQWTAPLPAVYRDRLRSTNQEHYQDGDTLYVVGGYGASADGSNPASYQTYPYLTAIDVPAMTAAVIAQDSNALAASIVSIEDERMRVTGGALAKLGTCFYLVFGQNYDRIYKGAYVGKYTEEIRRFRIERSGSQLSIVDYVAFKDLSGGGPASQYHRRDLNVCNGVRADGSLGLNVFSGVFTPGASAWLNPITIDQDAAGKTTIRVHMEFSQNWTNYEAANALLFDTETRTMFTSIFGGISYYYHDAQGKPTASNINNFTPFVKAINTIAQDRNGSFMEFVQAPEQSLPKFIGANAEFLPAPGIALIPETRNVIDYRKLPSGSKVVIGHIYGGIEATAEQSSEFNPTIASKTIYEVVLTRR